MSIPLRSSLVDSRTISMYRLLSDPSFLSLSPYRRRGGGHLYYTVFSTFLDPLKSNLSLYYSKTPLYFLPTEKGFQDLRFSP